MVETPMAAAATIMRGAAMIGIRGNTTNNSSRVMLMTSLKTSGTVRMTATPPPYIQHILALALSMNEAFQFPADILSPVRVVSASC